MKVCVTVEHRFERTPDRAVWTRSNHSYAESRRYLDAFDGVQILARVRDVAGPPQGGLRADGDGVTFGALPYYVGFQQFSMRWNSVRQAALGAIGDSDAVILKAPSVISCLIEPALRKQGRPFAVQVIADPWGIFSRGSLSHPLRPLVRSILTHRTAAQCRQASVVSYVTQKALQARYPASPTAFQAAISDVNLPANALANGPRHFSCLPAPVRLIAVGSLEQPYKGIDILLRALRICIGRGRDFRLSVIGDGRLRPGLTSLATQLGVDRFIEFRGAVPAGEEIFAALDQSDVFVMPSRQEGLPRAMLEAMARGLPCIGSAVGGIPELLAAEDLVEPGSPVLLASRILDVCGSPERMRQMSRRNLSLAGEFQEHILNARWREFFSHVRDATALWSTHNAAMNRLAGDRGVSMNSSPPTKAKPRVLQILTRLGAGGPPLSVILLTRELNRLGYDARLITGKCDHVDLDMSYLLTREDTVEWVPEMSRSVSLANDLRAIWHLYRIIRTAKPAIVQTHTAKAGVLGRIAARLAGVPVVIHTFHGHVMSGYFPAHISFAIRMIERILAKFSDIICVLAPQQQRDLVERFRIAPLGKVRVIPLGLDLAPFQKLSPAAAQDDWLTVGWLGRMVGVKNLPLLIEVMQETFNTRARIRFIVAGDGTERRLMEEATRRWSPDQLEWLGWTPDVASVVSRCDVLIQTSRNEGTPVALIQGMAAGKPFVSTPVGGVVDMVTGPGIRESAGCEWFSNAILVEPDPRIFASALCRLQQDRERLRAMGREAATFAAGHYNLDLLARNYAQLYAALLEGRRGFECPETPRKAIREPGTRSQPHRSSHGRRFRDEAHKDRTEGLKRAEARTHSFWPE